MAVLRYLDEDTVEVPHLASLRYMVACAVMALAGAAMVIAAAAWWSGLHAWLSAILGIIMVWGGLLVGGQVTRFVINRQTGRLIKRWGLLRCTNEQVMEVEPTGVQIAVNLDHDGDEVRQLYLVHRVGSVKLGDSQLPPKALRTLARELSDFLGVEAFEDRQYHLYGPLGPKTSPGAEPTRTYLSDGTTEPLGDLNEVAEDLEKVAGPTAPPGVNRLPTG